MSLMDVEQTNLWTVCDVDGVCHCDWRLTASGCEQQETIKIIYIVNAALSGFVGCLALWISYHRIIVLKQDILDFRTGFPRPKPIESMAVMGTIFNFLRMAHAIILTVDGIPNVAFRSFFFEFPWQFGFGALACYFFGIAHTLSDSSKIIYDNWVRSPIIIDGTCVAIISLPFITNNICAIAAGVFAVQGNIHMATKFTDALYCFWTFYTGTLAIIILYAGIRLLRLLRSHLLEKSEGRVNVAKVKLGALKVQIIVFTAFICLGVFAIILGLYAALRIPITVNKAYNGVIAAIWTYDGALATAFIEFAIVLNPRIATLASAFGSSSGTGLGKLSSSGPFASQGVTSNYTSNFGNSVTLGATSTTDQKDTKWNGRGSIVSGWTLTGSDATRSKVQSGDLGSPRGDSFHYNRHEFGSDHQIRSRIEEEQIHYNALTSIARAPPRNTSPTSPPGSPPGSPPLEDYRYRMPDMTFNDGSTTSSATYLTHHQGHP
ncbi:hypothetical protein BDA99DRAFT_497176 [Phascolomyces articulosus]|uniref:Uncharacterized protein n=1 Tax=Phascolomyces articulosus TaxID=60185 RepID=A0AAD5KR08_9FUNG|nr:hypothetical protein BDA99DRAFT_497176 [Phascolomyces articulosus]